MSPKEPDLLFGTSLYFPPMLNSALEPLLLAILRHEDGGGAGVGGGKAGRGWKPPGLFHLAELKSEAGNLKPRLCSYYRAQRRLREAESPPLAEGQAAICEGWSLLLKLGHLVFGRPPLFRIRGDVAGWGRGAVN